MNFPRAKCNLYDYGTKTPLAVMWKDKIKGGLEVTDFVTLADLAPTFMEAAGMKPLPEMTGRSWIPILNAGKSGRVDNRQYILSGRERHGWIRENGKGYPMRAIRTDDWLYIRNYAPDLWPTADPKSRNLSKFEGATGPSLIAMLDEPEKNAELIRLAFGKRPPEELYDLRNDPDQFKNLAGQPEYAETRKLLAGKLEQELKATADPRAFGKGDVFDSYPSFCQGSPDWKKMKQRKKQASQQNE